MKAKRARHKTGREKVPISFSITMSQIKWLDDHKEINQSHLVTSLLADYIEASNAVQPDKVKLILKLRALKTELEKAETELYRSEREFISVKSDYKYAMEYLKNLRHFTQLPTEQLKIGFDELNNPDIVWIWDKNSKDGIPNVSFNHKGMKEPAQIYANLLELLNQAEGIEYQHKLERLKQAIELPENIYNAFKQNYENISKQIREIEKLIVKQE